MKKISMFFMTAAMIAFVACGGGEKKGDAESAVGEEETVVVEEAPAVNSGSDIVAQYQALCDKLIELAPKMKTGNMDAVQEYQKVAQEFANFAQENATAWNNLSEVDLQKIQEIAQKAAEAMQ